MFSQQMVNTIDENGENGDTHNQTWSQQYIFELSQLLLVHVAEVDTAARFHAHTSPPSSTSSCTCSRAGHELAL